MDIIRNNMIPYGKQSIHQSDIDAVIESLASDFLTTGPAVEKFEAQLCALTGAQYAIACANGTAALHLACMALDVKNGDLGVTTPLTFLASANCIEFCGGSVDFVDIDLNTLCISPEKLDEYCKKGTTPTVVIPVDFAGVPADLPEIWALANKYGFKVIEDAAHSIGTTYTHAEKEYACGSCAHSDLAIFSFHPVKTITTGEGGAILTNSKMLTDKLRLHRSHGMTKDPAVLARKDGSWYYEMHELGYNYRITDLQCALGISQLKRLDFFKTRRKEIVEKYNEAFINNPAFILPPWPQNTDPCFHLYPLQLVKGSHARLNFFDNLHKADIRAQIHYYPVHLQPYYAKKYGYAAGKCPNAELYYERCISLPLYPAMTNADVEYVIENVSKYAGN